MSNSLHHREHFLKRQVRTRSWSDISDIIDEEMDTSNCRCFQGVFVTILLIAGSIMYIKMLKPF